MYETGGASCFCIEMYNTCQIASFHHFTDYEGMTWLKPKPKHLFYSTTKDPYAVPDRVTGRQGLQVLNPNRHWNFVEVSILSAEV